MNEKQVTLITIVVLVLFLLAGGGGFYYLYFVILDEKTQELDALKTQVAEAEAKVAKIDDLKKQIVALQEQEKEKIKKIPNLTRQEYDGFAVLLDKFRTQSGVEVSRGSWATPTQPAPVPGYKPVQVPNTVHKVQYDLTATGSFYQLLRYVNLLEEQTRFIGVKDFSIGKASGQETRGGAPKVPKRDLKVTIYSYTYKLPPAPFVIEIKEPQVGRSTEIPD
jgi:Tfp pilus assembly protein PilO